MYALAALVALSLAQWWHDRRLERGYQPSAAELVDAIRTLAGPDSSAGRTRR